MAGFDKYSNYNENTSFSSVIFGAEKPVLEVELNELQQIINTTIKRLAGVLGSCVVPLSNGSISYSSSDKKITISKCVIMTDNGLTAYVDYMYNSIVAGEVYFKVQEIDVDSTTIMKKYGNTEGSEVPNTIVDSRVNVETSRRKAVVYTLMNSSSVPADTETEKYVRVGKLYGDVLTLNSTTGIYRYALLDSPTFVNALSLGKRTSGTVGVGSVSFGGANLVSGKYALALGESNTASGMRALTVGISNTASGTNSQASGNGSEATETGAIASGYQSKASGQYSVAENYKTKASGENSHAEGYNTEALANQHAEGHYNDTSVATANTSSGASTGTAFVIGNGTSSAKSNAFRVQNDGATYAKGAYNATGADYAEYVEWADGNPDEEDRRGYFVTFDENAPNKIRKSKADDIYILGVVSGNPGIIGNADECWLGKNLFDEFNSPIYETIEETIEELDPETGEVTTRTIQVLQHKVNPEYDPTQEYKHRSERPEWSAVGLIGVMSVRDDGTCTAGGYCTWGDGGIAKTAEASCSNYRVLERVSENIIKIVVK